MVSTLCTVDQFFDTVSALCTLDKFFDTVSALCTVDQLFDTVSALCTVDYILCAVDYRQVLLLWSLNGDIHHPSDFGYRFRYRLHDFNYILRG